MPKIIDNYDNPKACREMAKKRLLQARAILDSCKDQKRGLEGEELKQYDSLKAEADSLIARAERLEAEENGNGNGNGNSDGALWGAGPRGLPGDRQQQRGEPLFRDEATGRIIAALGPNDRLCTEPPELGIGEAILARAQGRFQNVAQSEGVDSDGGYFLGPAYSSAIIDLARAASVAVRAGVRTIPMPTSQLRLAKIESDPSPTWRRETVAIPASKAGFGLLQMEAKTLGVLVPLSYELISDSANAAQAIEHAMTMAIAGALDSAILMGSGAGAEPRGIIHTSGVNTLAAIGTPDSYAKPSSAVGQILQANYNGPIDGLSWVLHPRDAEVLDQLTDQQGQPLQMSKWVSQLQQYSTTKLPVDGGVGENESTQLIGDFSQCVLGVRNDLQLEMSRTATATDSDGNSFSAFEQVGILLRAIVRVDVGVLRPSWFTVLSGITTGE